MGEIAEMMLDGTLCQYCGVYIGSDAGYPQSCGCDEERERPMKKTSDLLAVKKTEDISKVSEFLDGREYNFVKGGKVDKFGQPMIGLMFTLPGQMADKRGIIICGNDALYREVYPLVQRRKIRRERPDEA